VGNNKGEEKEKKWFATHLYGGGVCDGSPFDNLPIETGLGGGVSGNKNRGVVRKSAKLREEDENGKGGKIFQINKQSYSCEF